jgi:tetratricopeptide (TPR) repeat protein
MTTSAPQTQRPSMERVLIPGIAVSILIIAAVLFWMRRAADTASATTDTGTTDVAKDREFRTELGLARRAAEREDFQKALQYCDAALQMSPDNIEANLLKADVLFRLHRPDEMRAVLERVLEQDAEHFEAHAILAHALRLSGELDAAAEHVEWCLTQRPDFLPARRMKAEILRDRGETEKALEEIRQAIADGSAELDSHLLLAELLMYERRFEDAYAGLAPLASSFESNHRYAATMARLCQVLNRTDEANRYRAVLEQLKAGMPVD